MSQSRVAGWALLVGALLTFVSDIPGNLLFPGIDMAHEVMHPLNGPVHLTQASGCLLLLWGLPTLAAYGPKGLGWLGGIGALLIFVALAVIGVFFSLVAVLLTPFLAQHAPEWFVAGPSPGILASYLVANLAQLSGTVLLGIALLRSSSFDRWPIYVLLASAPLLVVRSILGETMGVDFPFSPVLGVIAALADRLLVIALGWLGWLMTASQAQPIAVGL
jgi:hypothetical protein